MLVFWTKDQHHRAQDTAPEAKAWFSILPFWKWALENLRPYKHLYGLCQQLGVVIRTYASVQASQRFFRNQKAEELEDSELRVFFTENARITHELAVGGAKNLSIQTIIADYPRTWRNQADAEDMGAGQEPLTASDWSGPYFLPLGPQTTPVQAVRMGVILIQEWAEHRGLEYKVQLTQQSKEI